nr:hypothetical protein [uncultured Blautia sp.]
MWNLIKSEWKKIRLPVLASAFLLTTAACVLSTTLYKSYTLQYSLDAWEIGTEIFSLLFPLFVVMPLCWNLYYERRNNFILYVLPRVPAKKYLGAKWLVYALSAFFILFVPYLLSALCALYINPPVPLNASAGNAAFDHVFLNAFTQTPLLYALLLSCWKGIIGILVMSLGFALSMYLKNIFVILTGPFVYVMLENFVLSILQLAQYRLVVAFEPTCISSDAVSGGSFFAGPALLAAGIFLTVFFLKKVKKYTVVTV